MGHSSDTLNVSNFQDLPGHFNMIKQDQIRLGVDPIEFYNEKYEEAKQHHPRQPIIKMNVMGVHSVGLFSHKLVRQFQGYELRGQTRRIFAPHLEKLFGKSVEDMYGKAHLKWRANASKGFKPNIIDQYTPFIQRAAESILLEGIYRENQRTGDYVHFLWEAKRFAFVIGIKFVYGPLLSDGERDSIFPIFQNYAAALGPAAFDDLEAKDPDSVLSKAYRARDELNELLKVKYEEAMKLTEENRWHEQYGADSECLLKTLLENDGMLIALHCLECQQNEHFINMICSGIFDNGGEYGLEDKVDNTLALAFAAYDTTSTSMANLVWAMATHKEETEKVRTAILKHPQLSDPNTSFSIDLLSSCNELENFILETQRMYGIAPLLVRKVNDENGLDFGGINIPNGYGLLIPIKFLHHGDGSWVDAMEFKPSRFDKSEGQTKADRGIIGRYGNIPFATGLHKCLGIHLAMLELRAYTALLLRDWEVEIDPKKLGDAGLINKWMMMRKGVLNKKNLMMGIPHYNVYLKLTKRESM